MNQEAMTVAPVFDPKKPYGVIMHGNITGVDPSSLPRFHQAGNYFRPDHSFHSKDGLAKPKEAVAVVAKADKQTKPAMAEADVSDALLDSRAEELLTLPRDKLIALVMAADGPVIQGEGSTQNMVAWLIKNTAPSEL